MLITPKKLKQGIEEIFVHACSRQDYLQKAERWKQFMYPLADEWITKCGMYVE
jgi:hypothetical protein